MNLETIIANRRNTLRTDRLDMSFGELMNLFEEETLFITPEYQRVFRWDIFKQTNFIESILLGIPVPPIFVAEDTLGKWELVDGLQRTSTIFSFFGLLNKSPEKNNLKLAKGELIEELEDITIDTIPLLLKHTLKRAVCRVEIIRWDSSIDMRYELFSRLNTGSSPLTDQEIRNCIFRGYSNELNSILINIGQSKEFKNLISPTQRQIEEMFCEELILRFFTFKNYGVILKTNLPTHLTEYMRKVSKNDLQFNYIEEKANIEKLINFLNTNFDYSIFRATNGIFTPNYFDAILLALNEQFDRFSSNPNLFKEKIQEFKLDKTYKDVGQKSYSQSRIENKLNIALEIFRK